MIRIKQSQNLKECNRAGVVTPGIEDDRAARLLSAAGEVGDQVVVHINAVRGWDNKGILKTYRVEGCCDGRYLGGIDSFLGRQRGV